MSLTLGAALGIAGGSALLNGGLGLLSGSLNKSAAEDAIERQIQGSKELFDYQWNKANSPEAMVRNLGKAGLNPAAYFGNQSPVSIGGNLSMSSPANYNLGVGTQSVGDIASLLVGAAQAKKAGIETESILQDVDAKRLQNDILRSYGMPKAAQELALAYEQVKLAKQSGDLNELEKSFKNWSIAKEHALAESSAHQRDILKKQLDNEDTRLRLSNQLQTEQISTEKTKQQANVASAEQSRAAASDLRQSAKGKELLNNISQATNLYDIENALYNADVIRLLQQSKNKEAIMQELQRLVKVSKAYKTSDDVKKIDAVLEHLVSILGIKTSVSVNP